MRTIRVLFDSTVFAVQTYGGISRYFTELIERLPHYDIQPRLYAPFNSNAHLQDCRPAGSISFPLPKVLANDLTLRAAAKFQRITERMASRVLRFDIFHQTYYTRRLPDVRPTVVTVVDMIPELHPEDFPQGNPHEGKAEAVKRAAVVLAISESTRADIRRYFADLAVPVRVIPLAVDERRFEDRARGAGGEDGTILFVGARSGYKNFGTFAEAAARVLAKQSELRLVCVGGGRLREDEMHPFRRCGVAQRVSQASVAEEDLPGFYHRALVFVYPSLCEGFGLPILEAFASGCPVALSMASSFPEVADEAGAYFDPTNADSIEETLQRVTADASYREELRKRGRLRLSHYSWDRTAELTAEAYRDVVSCAKPCPGWM
jgi:glycosyltransferase involved in cell wall biosynthesis